MLMADVQLSLQAYFAVPLLSMRLSFVMVSTVLVSRSTVFLVISLPFSSVAAGRHSGLAAIYVVICCIPIIVGRITGVKSAGDLGCAGMLLSSQFNINYFAISEVDQWWSDFVQEWTNIGECPAQLVSFAISWFGIFPRHGEGLRRITCCRL